MTLAELLEEGTVQLRKAGVPDAGQDARLLLLDTFAVDLVHFLLERGRTVSSEGDDARRCRCYRDRIAKRSSRIPVQQILGSQDFMGLKFEIDEHVLIPRQDTETLVEWVLEEQRERNLRILDLCPGSGCIAVSLAVRGGYQSVAGTDISAQALAVARRNAARLMAGRSETVIFWEGDLFDAVPTDAPGFDVITANPPYIPSEVIRTLEPEVREHEPRLALDGSPDGLAFYRRIIREAGRYLAPGGVLYLEISWDQGAPVCALMEQGGFERVCVKKDLPGMDRVVRGRLPAENCDVMTGNGMGERNDV